MNGKDIVIVGLQPWDVEIGSNCKNLAMEFSKQNRVLYVNAPLDRITVLRHQDKENIKKRVNLIKKKKEAVFKQQENLWVYYPDTILESINWINNQWLFNILNKLNNRKYATAIKKAVQFLNFNNILLFNDNDIFRSLYLKELLQPEMSIYYCRDYLLAVDYWKKHGQKYEPLIIQKSDCCVTNSTHLANYCKQFNPHTFYVGQGCELDIFDPVKVRELPGDIRKISKPIIGYVGALQSLRLDINLLIHIATEKPDWSIVLVGPEDDIFKKSELHHMPNVYFLGAKDPAILPAYIYGFNVCLNPQVVNEVTIGNYPRKIDEYLAMGKPVVATDTEAMSIFKDHTYLGNNTKESYITLITKALDEDSEILQRNRRIFAQSHSWENSADKIYKAILTCMKTATT